MMSKTGRKRIEGARYESGRLLPSGRREEPSPALVARRAVMERQAGDSKWGSTLGLLYLEEQITSPEMRTGFAYGTLRARFDVAMGMPRRATQAMCYSDERKRTPRDMAAQEIDRLRETHAELLAKAGSHRALLDQVCCDDRQPAVGDILRLRVALRGLSTFFGVGDI